MVVHADAAPGSRLPGRATPGPRGSDPGSVRVPECVSIRLRRLVVAYSGSSYAGARREETGTAPAAPRERRPGRRGRMESTSVFDTSIPRVRGSPSSPGSIRSSTRRVIGRRDRAPPANREEAAEGRASAREPSPSCGARESCDATGRTGGNCWQALPGRCPVDVAGGLMDSAATCSHVETRRPALHRLRPLSVHALVRFRLAVPGEIWIRSCARRAAGI